MIAMFACGISYHLAESGLRAAGLSGSAAVVAGISVAAMVQHVVSVACIQGSSP
jgi:hypothetical protein